MKTDNKENKTSTTDKAGVSFNPLLYAVFDDRDDTLMCGGFTTKADAESRAEELEEEFGKGSVYVAVQENGI